MSFPFHDQRDYWNHLIETGDMVRCPEEVDWDMELCAIVRRTFERSGPGVFFEKVKDYPEWKVAGGAMGTYRKISMAMGLPPETPYQGICEEWERRMSGGKIKPIMVSPKDAPCKQNKIMDENKVNLYDLPIPMVHGGDGGRYITWHFVAARDPDTDWVNWGIQRVCVSSPHYGGILMGPTGDNGSILHGYYVPRKQPMPVAIAIGTDPVSMMMGIATIPRGEAEADWAGAIMGEPMHLVKCELSDIRVPANAELIVEGEVMANALVEEGSFGEVTGYRTSPRAPRVAFKAKAITYRNSPVYTTSSNGYGQDDHQIIFISQWYEIKKTLRAAGLPVTGIYLPAQMGHVGMVVVAVRNLHNGIATQVWEALAGAGHARPFTIVVEPDVNIYDFNEVWWTVLQRCHPQRGIRVMGGLPAGPLTPYLSPHERLFGPNARVLFDCMWPKEWRKETDIPPYVMFRNPDMYPKELQDKIVAKWNKYGFKD